MNAYPRIYPNAKRGDWIFVPQEFEVGEKVYRLEYVKGSEPTRHVFRPVTIKSAYLDYCRFRGYTIETASGEVCVGTDLYTLEEAKEFITLPILGGGINDTTIEL